MALFKPMCCVLGTPTFNQKFKQASKGLAVSLRCLKSTRSGKQFRSFKLRDVEAQIKPFNQATPKVQVPLQNVGNGSPVRTQPLWKPFVFTVAFSTTSLAGCAIWQYENIRKKALSLIKRPAAWASERLFRQTRKKVGWREECNRMWNKLSEGEKLFAPICFINVLVFLAWKVPRFQPAMLKYFCCDPYSKAVCWPMVLSTFSHFSALHLIANMYVLHSFSSTAVSTLGKEQFLGLYLAAGVISSFASVLYRVAISRQRSSLGASGAIMAILGYVCTQYPNTQLSIILLPMFTFSAGSAIKCIMVGDMMGVLFGFKIFDHAAHLGGALCGIGWCFWGNTYIWQNREPLLHWWHEMRTAAEK